MKNKPVIIVSGASRGIGEAVSRLLGDAGAAVSLLARSEKRLASVAEAIGDAGGETLIVPTDVADSEACRYAVAKTLERFGRLDGLVNCAGIVDPMATVIDADPDIWRRNIEVNLMGPFYLTHWALPHLRESKGRIVNVSSGAAHHTILAASAYCAAKAGLNHFTSVLAEEEPSVTAIAMRPGVVDTPMQAQLRAEGPGVMPPEQADFYITLKETGQLEPPQVPGRVIAWLVLDAPRQWSGRFLNYDDTEVTTATDRFFSLNEKSNADS